MKGDLGWKCDGCGHIHGNKKKAERCEASHLIEEKMRTGKYPRKQAIAIGLSRARAAGIKVPRK